MLESRGISVRTVCVSTQTTEKTPLFLKIAAITSNIPFSLSKGWQSGLKTSVDAARYSVVSHYSHFSDMIMWSLGNMLSRAAGTGKYQTITEIDRQSICQCLGWQPPRLTPTCFTQASAKPAAFRPVTSKLLGTMCLIIPESSPELQHRLLTILPRGREKCHWSIGKQMQHVQQNPSGSLKTGE